MGGRGGASPAGRQTLTQESTVSELKERMLNSILNMQQTQSDSIVGLEAVRLAFEPVWTRDQVTEALKELSRERKILLIPQENQKVLTQRRRDSSVRLGGEDKHLVRITGLGRSSLS
jgi:hypothetical protein